MASAARVSGSPWKQCTPCSRTHLCPKRTHFSLLGCRWHGKEKLLHEKEEEKQNNSPRPSPFAPCDISPIVWPATWAHLLFPIK